MINREFAELYRQVEAGLTADITRTVDGQTYRRKFIPTDRLILLGAGHIAQPLCSIASMLDFSVTVVDDRSSFANTERFPDAAFVICDNFSDAIQKLNIRAADYVCVITRGHRWDADCLRQILPNTMPSYLGMIGSSRRVSGLLALLEEEGFDRERLSAIHSPIGLKINAATPAEIAVSICAEMIAHRRRLPKDTEEALPQTNVDTAMLRFLGSDPGQKAVMMVISSTGSTPVKAGAMMAIDASGNTYGTIGGGCSEAAVMLHARRLLGSGKSKIITVDMTNDVAEEEGMVCGGTMQVIIEDATAQPEP